MTDFTQQPASTDAQGPSIVGIVKSYNPDKGYGFVVPEEYANPPSGQSDRSHDVFCHVHHINPAADGKKVIFKGQRVSFVLRNENGKRIAVNISPLGPAPVAPQAEAKAVPSRPTDAPLTTGVVKRYDAKKGWGFILPSDGSSDIFVHYLDIIGQGYRLLMAHEQVEFVLVSDGQKRVAKYVTAPGGRPIARAGGFPHAHTGGPKGQRMGPGMHAAAAAGMMGVGMGVPVMPGMMPYGHHAHGPRHPRPATGAVPLQSSGQLLRGTCTRFDPKKGYGFIRTADASATDVFVHFTAIRSSGHKSLTPGEMVDFELGVNPDGKPAAISVTAPGGAPVRGAVPVNGQQPQQQQQQQRFPRQSQGAGVERKVDGSSGAPSDMQHAAVASMYPGYFPSYVAAGQPAQPGVAAPAGGAQAGGKPATLFFTGHPQAGGAPTQAAPAAGYYLSTGPSHLA